MSAAMNGGVQVDLGPYTDDYRGFTEYRYVIMVMLGLAIWEHVATFGFEVQIWTGRRPFKWPVALFMLTRYSIWLAMIPNILLIHSDWKLNCDTVYYMIVAGTCLEVFLGQAIFTVRALAVWEYNKWVITMLVVVWIPHIVFSLSTATAAKLTWYTSLVANDGGFCSITYVTPQWRYPLAYALILFTDLFIMGLVTYKLVQLRHNAGSSLLNLLVRDGIVYCAICAIPTLVAIIVFSSISDNPTLRSSALTFSCLFHAILACRAFMNLSNLCERLPTSIRMKVSNGTMLDQDTLARIAFHLGPSLEEKDIGLGDTALPTVSQQRPSSGGTGSSIKKGEFSARNSQATNHSPQFNSPNLRSNDSSFVPRPSYSAGPIVHTMTQSEWDEDVVRDAWDPVENLNGRGRLNSFGTETMTPSSRKEAGIERFP